MNRSDLIAALAAKEQMTEKNALEIIDSVVKGFTNALIQGGRIEIRGFGSFSVREYGSYRGRNPRTGMKVDVKPKKLPFFKVGKELKTRINGGLQER